MSSQNEKKTPKIKNKFLAVVGAIVAVLLIIGSFVINSDFFYTGTPAMKIGDTEYTVAEFNYHYFNAYSSFMEASGDMASLILNTEVPFDEQNFTEEMTFHDYFTQEAIASMKVTQVLYDLAPSKELTEEQSAIVENEIASIIMYAPIYGMTEAQLLTSNYGNGFTTDVYRDVLTKSVIANDYGMSVAESYEYTEEELVAKYDENRDGNAIIEYRAYFVANGEDQEEAHATADAIAEATNGDEFADLVYEYAPEDSKESFTENEATLSVLTGDYLASYDYGSWLTDASRQEFDTTVVESVSGSGYYVVMFVSREDNDYNTRDIRHILITAEIDAETGVASDEANATALAEAERILAEFEAGDMTEDSFAALANQYSQDPGSNTNGGLYENVAKNQMVTEFNDFLFAAEEAGETGIVYDATTGYHVVYYVGEGAQYSNLIAENNLRQEEYTTWIEAETAKLGEPTTEFAFRFAG